MSREPTDIAAEARTLLDALAYSTDPAAFQTLLEVAIDGLAERFGTNVVYRADDLNKPAGTRLAPTLDFLRDHLD